MPFESCKATTSPVVAYLATEQTLCVRRGTVGETGEKWAINNNHCLRMATCYRSQTKLSTIGSTFMFTYLLIQMVVNHTVWSGK